MIGHYTAFDGENEALFIADTIERLLSVNRRLRVAILYRTNFQSRQIEEALRRYGRKYVIVGGFSFYQRAEIKDALAYLKAALSPQDSISLLRIINTPARGIGRTSMEQIEKYRAREGISMWDAIGRMLDEGAISDARPIGPAGVPHDDAGNDRVRSRAARSIRRSSSSSIVPATGRCSKTTTLPRPSTAWRT